MSVERQKEFLGEDFLWERQRQEEEGERQEEEERQGENGLSERQIEEEEKKKVTETAFLVTRTNQQALALIMVGRLREAFL